MANRAIIFHGTGGSPDNVWYPWLDRCLTERSWSVDRPSYPLLNEEPIDTFLPQVLESHRFDTDTVLVGHSGGAALILAVLEQLDVTVAQAVLVAGYSTPPNDQAEPVLQAQYDWKQIRSAATEFVFVNSVDDPYGCDAAQGRAMFDRLGGTLVIRDDGHSGDWDQPFPTFPLLEQLI